MSVAARFVLPLLLVLALLTWVSSRAIERITDGWIERDLGTRAELAISSARDSLIPAWEASNRARVQRFLSGLTRDDRILGAIACDARLKPLAETSRFPGPLSCERLGRNLSRAGSGTPDTWRSWYGGVPLFGQEVHVSAIPLVDDGGETLGFVALVHNLRFEEQRRATIQRILLFAFATLTAVASLLMAIVARLSWQNWLRYVRRLLRGEKRATEEATGRPEFSPIAQDVRDLIARIGDDERVGPRGRWTPDRLRQILRGELAGEKVIIVANREPYIHDRVPIPGPHGKVGSGTGSGTEIVVRFPASGLVSALEPVMRACSGVWIAHGSGSADRETADANGRLRVPPGEEAYSLRRVWLSRDEERGYYYGFSNEGLWPLCHFAHARPIFRAEDWAHYRAVNQRFADAVCDEADSDDPIVLVQDYHFALVPQLVRRRLPRATILTFWHIPWPNAESFGICPWREQILEGLLGSSIMGFHTRLHCNNFIEAIDRYIEARIDRQEVAVFHEGQMTAVRAYPISIEWPSRWLPQLPPVADCRRSVIEELGLPDDALIGVGVDRLDYTKGIEERFLAIESLLERQAEMRGRFTFIELGAPSRVEIPLYQQLDRDIDALAARINQRFGSGHNGSGYRPIIILRAQHQPLTVFRYFRAADLCYVSSLHDGMNLVAKEFVAARDDERGVLVLSDFTGAARELTEALIVNPYDIGQASAALAAALRMGVDEQSERMHALRALVGEYNVYRWAGRMLLDAARQRRRDRLIDRLAESQVSAPLF